MKKTKLLLPILGVPALFATTLPAIVSCKNGGGGEVDGPEEIVMPEVEAQETTAALGDVNAGEPQAYQYITIPNIKWKNPKHVFYGIEPRIQVTSETSVWLLSKIIPNVETTSFDVMVYFTDMDFGIKAGTQIDFDLSIWANDIGQPIQISKSKSYSMVVKTAVLWDKKMSYQKVTEGTDHFSGEQWFWLANYDYDKLEGPKEVPVDGFDNKKFGTVKCQADLHQVGDYGLSGRLMYSSEAYVDEFEGDDFTAKLSISHNGNETAEFNIDGIAVSQIDINYNNQPISISKTGDKVYECDTVAGQITWTNADAGKGAGDLTWILESHWYQDWFKSMEVTSNPDQTVHFKLTTNIDLEIGFSFNVPFTVSYKNAEGNPKNPLNIYFEIPKP